MFRLTPRIYSNIIKKCIYNKSIIQNVKTLPKFSQIQNVNLARFSSQAEDKSKSFNEKIYNGALTPQIKAVKVFSLVSSIMGLAAQPFLYVKAASLGTGVVIGVYGVVGFFTFITPFLLHLITKKYVTCIDYDESTQKYRSTTISFFLQKKQIEFSPDDVYVPDVPGMFTTLMVKNKPLFIVLSEFSDPQHYGKIMGYDKPMDFRFDEVSAEEPSDKPKKNT